MIEMDFITLEDGVDYAIVDEIIIDDIKYLYLVNNDNKVELRKLDYNENLVRVTKEESDMALVEFAKLHKNDLV